MGKWSFWDLFGRVAVSETMRKTQADMVAISIGVGTKTKGRMFEQLYEFMYIYMY